MRLIKQGFEIIEQPSGLEGMYKMIEMAGRTCYKSEDKITETSAKEFVDRMIKSGHGAMLEHGTVYLEAETKLVNYYIHPEDGEDEEYNPLEKYYNNKYSYVNIGEDDNLYVTTNLRVLVENGWLDDLKYWCEPTEYHEKRYTVKWIIDRVTGESFLRHRVFSFARESTRYCNYSKDKFGNEITFIIPCWLDVLEGKYTNIAKQSNEDGEYKQIMVHENNTNAYPLTTTPEGRFLWNCYWDEHDYFDLLNYGWKPQQARQVLPFSVSSPLVMTGFASDWLHFFDLRCDSHAHPQAREIATALKEEFIKRKYIKE